jgi:hypothetical protein
MVSDSGGDQRRLTLLHLSSQSFWEVGGPHPRAIERSFPAGRGEGGSADSEFGHHRANLKRATNVPRFNEWHWLQRTLRVHVRTMRLVSDSARM